ncbi:MAG: nicotinate-nucleotide--dimethylbenzimidazole phosphoribosyltransferase [Nocardiopsaceae bacterium]|nr:nicotinate-nucleotide--dimethylbenzimidazole phosphoribosyltransferase [Nocardiopsaceae bacterium]
MTGNDHRSAKSDGGPGEDRSQSAFGGGLLDDLPEAGRGAEPARSQGQPRTNPFHVPSEQSTPLQPNVIPFRSGGQFAVPEAEAAKLAVSAETAGASVETAPAERGSRRAAASTAATDTATAAPESPGRTERKEHAESRPRQDTHAYGTEEREAVYRAIRERRDVRMGFRADPIPDEVLTRVLEAAHRAPSVGYSQPWDFIVVHDEGVRSRVQELVQSQREEYARALPGARARAFSGLKVEAILDTPVNIVVTVDPTRGGRHTLGRHAQPQTAGYSAALAVENLWLAARAEGLGVGWVSFFQERDLARGLDLPAHLEVVAYLCVGYVDDFPAEPELALSGWARGRPLSWAVHRDHYGRRGLPGDAPTSLLEETITAIGPLNQRAVNEARERQGRMTKPPGSLGVLEEVSVRLSGLAGECPPPIPEPAAVAIFAGDHGVHAQGVTHWPQEVTTQMVQNFLQGGAVVNAFANQVGAEVTVVDVGVIGDLPKVPGLLPRKIARGTADITQAPAMSRAEAESAIEAGVEVARDLVSAGNRCLVTGDMGIANTTPSAALISAFTGADPAEVTGRGTGVDDAVHEHKIEVVRQALAFHRIDRADPVGVLAAVGGMEHAALAGFILGAAALRVPVLLDGVIAGAASLAATAIAPDAVHACFAGHRSTEPGHAAVLRHVGLHPLVDLEMRLGEGSGALLALPLLQGAARALRDVATFDSAGVSKKG